MTTKEQTTTTAAIDGKPVLPAFVTIRGKNVELKKGNEFLDNGACIQLLRSWPAPSTIIPKKVWKELLPFLTEVEQHSWANCRLYRNSFDDEKDVYGDKLNQWHDSSFEKGDGDSFTYSTKKGTVMYGKDLDEGDFFASFTTEKHYMEFAPQKSYKFKTMKEAKEKAMQLLKSI